MTRSVISVSIAILSATFSLTGQDINTFLEKVAIGNPGIIAYSRLLEVRKAEAMTGITPSDPVVSFGYMPGSTDDMGVKRTWGVSQSFSFPSKYLIQRKLGKGTIALASLEFDLARLNILKDAKLLVYEYIYNRKRYEVYDQRKVLFDHMSAIREKMLKSGEATILEHNRIQLELSSIELEMTRLAVNLRNLKDRMALLSGDTASLPLIAEYLPAPAPLFEDLIREKSLVHPAFLLPEAEYRTSLDEVKLSRTGNLPEFQVGVGSETIPGESYTGPVAGLSIPLWSNSNRVRAAVYRSDYTAFRRDATLLELKSDIRTEFENMKALSESISGLRKIFDPISFRYFPDKAFDAGEISLNDYFIYLRSLFDTEDRLLELEYEFNRSIALLFDHVLIQVILPPAYEPEKN